MKKTLLIILITIPYFCFPDCNQPNFCDRNCWDPNGIHPEQSNPSFTNVTHVIVHHTGDGIVFPSGTDFAEKVRFYWDLHVNTNGWSDIGYNWLIDRNGIIYEGRGDGVLGAHFSGMNGGTMGVALIGDFSLETPSSNALNSLEDLIAWEVTDKNINVSATSFHLSSGLNLNNVSGHLDGGSGTICPGSDLYNLLPSIRMNISNLSCYNGGGTNVPDLVIEEMWTEPSNPQIGENVDLYVRIKNVGNEIAENIDLEYFIDGNYIDDDTHSSLGPNEEREEYENNHVFNSEGNYNYCVFIDPVANELNTSNNSFCITINVGGSGGQDNIQVSNTTVNPVIVTAGNNINVSATQSYSGSQLDADLPSFDLDYYLSTDCNLSQDDILLGGDSSSLGSDDPSHDENETLTIPESTTPGTYFIIFSADNEDELLEINENDNIDCVQLTVNSSDNSGNIQVSNAIVNPIVVTAGNTIDVSATQSYTGSQLDADLPSFDLDYYLSTDCNLSQDDILLGGDSSSLGADDPNDDESETLTIPSNILAGTYYIIFSSDNDNELIESNEDDNLMCIQITVEDILSISDYDFVKQIKIYPNPSSNIINITSDGELTINKITIYDLNGQEIKKFQGIKLNRVNLSSLSNGTYLIQIEDANKGKAVFKILKN